MKNTTEPCTICEKPVSLTRPHWMVEILTDNLGWHPVGPECRKNLAGTTQGIIQYGAVERWS